MKTQVLRLVLLFVLANLVSCTISVDGNGRPFMVSQQPVHVGTGMSPRGPIHGQLLAYGSAGVFGQCTPQGAQTYATLQTFPAGNGPYYGNPSQSRQPRYSDYYDGQGRYIGGNNQFPQQYQQNGRVYLNHTTPPQRRYPMPRQSVPGITGVPLGWR